jgi:hypothetical protein
MVLQELDKEEGRQKVDEGQKMPLYFVLPVNNIIIAITLVALIFKRCVFDTERENERERERDLNRFRHLFIWYLKSGQASSLAAFTSSSGGPQYVD